jgi:hypothetical protein
VEIIEPVNMVQFHIHDNHKSHLSQVRVLRFYDSTFALDSQAAEGLFRKDLQDLQREQWCTNKKKNLPD